MSALAVTELLESAQDQRVELSFDITSLENQGLIDTIEKMNLDSMTPAAKRRSVVELVRILSLGLLHYSCRRL